MSWNWEDFIKRLRAAVDNYDRTATIALCDELIEQVRTSEASFLADVVVSTLRILRRKRLFDLMERVGQEVLLNGQRDPRMRAEYAQALIDLGKLEAARAILAEIISETAAGSFENARAQGLLGRTLKQIYVSAQKQHSRRRGSVLAEAAVAYSVPLRDGNLVEFPWHAINLVAVTARARKDGIPLVGFQAPEDLAKRILALLDRRDPYEIAPFDLATAAEACVALGDGSGALKWLRHYLANKETDAFEVSSTYRQMVEVWQLTDAEEPGASVLPVLRQGLLVRPGAFMELSPTELRAAVGGTGAEESFERVFGSDGPRTLSWYRTMLQRATTVARVESRSEPGRGVGTGFLVDALEFIPESSDRFVEGEMLLLTNSHVVSSDDTEALRPSFASVSFEALDPPRKDLQVNEILWESPRHLLDATILRLAPTVSKMAPCELTPDIEKPTFAPGKQRRVYVIGHPLGGPMSISLQDSLQVGWLEPRLHYRTPTEPGSSGSPVFDEHWRLLALHHRGSDTIERLDGSSGTYQANEGIWIHAIRAESRLQRPK